MLARSASAQASASIASSSPLDSASSAIASTTRSQSARSAGSVVTRIRVGRRRRRASSPRPAPLPRPATPRRRCAPAAAPRRPGSRRRRARRRSTPLPAIPGRSYPSEPPIAAWLLSRPAMLRRISSFAAGRRSKWVVIAVWVIVGFALFRFQPKLQEATTNENEAFLPENAESTEVNDLVEERFADGREVDILVVYNREGGPDRGRPARGSATDAREPRRRDGAGEPGEPLRARRARSACWRDRRPVRRARSAAREPIATAAPAAGAGGSADRGRAPDGLRGRLDGAAADPHQLRGLRGHPGQRRRAARDRCPTPTPARASCAPT